MAIFPEFAEIDATGVPLFTFINANFALVVACPPTNTSSVEFAGNMAPLALFHTAAALPPHAPHVGLPPPPDTKHCPLLPAVLNAYAVPVP